MPEVKPTNFRHGAAYSGHIQPEYRAWTNIRYACRKAVQAAEPGTSVPTVYEAWDRSFPAFLADVGPRPSPRHMLVRLDPQADWAPGNVEWSLGKAARVRRRPNIRHVEINGRRVTVQGKAAPKPARHPEVRS